MRLPPRPRVFASCLVTRSGRRPRRLKHTHVTLVSQTSQGYRLQAIFRAILLQTVVTKVKTLMKQATCISTLLSTCTF